MKTDFVIRLKLAKEVFEQYKQDQEKWWRRMDGTPILNDIAVRMAEKFGDHIYGLENVHELNNDLLKKLCSRAADALEMWQGGWKYSDMTTDLIAELRKAAE